MQTTSFLHSIANYLHTLKVIRTFVSFFVSTACKVADAHSITRKLHGKCPTCLINLIKIEMSRHFLVKLPSIKFHEDLLPDRRSDSTTAPCHVDRPKNDGPHST